jgi:site-specific recombinase XerD
VFPSPNPEDRSPAALIAAFLESRTDTCNEASQSTYTAYLRQFELWLDGRPISALMVGAYLRDLRTRKLATATLGNHYRMLKTCCRWLVVEGKLDSDPFVGPSRVKPPAQKRKRRKVYSEEQVVTLLMSAHDRIVKRAEAQRWRPSKNPYLLRDALQSRALILLLCDSALRAAEVCALDCGQIRDSEMIVLSKGGHEDAAFITKTTRQVLLGLALDRPDDAPLFVDVDMGRCTTRALRGCLRRLAARAGVPLVPRPLHAFRHLAARQWLKSGLGDLTIMQLMRHQDLATTRIYTQLDATELAELHAGASPVARMLAAAEDGYDAR